MSTVTKNKTHWAFRPLLADAFVQNLCTLSRGLALASILGLAGCASNESLFAEYDALCHGGVCVAPAATEVFYSSEQVSLVWEPAVYFGFDLDTLQPSESMRIDRNLEFLQQYPELTISLQAFADSSGSARYNMELSERRRQHVYDYLVAQGLDELRIFSSIAGELVPIHSGTSVEERIINRRVEMMLLDNSGRPLSIGVDPNAAAGEPFSAPTPSERPGN